MKAGVFGDVPRAQSRFMAEKRIFLKSDSGTRFVRLGRREQLVAWGGGLLLVGWTVTATALVTVQYFDGRSQREQAAEDRAAYETRLNALAADRDGRRAEALEAQANFSTLLDKLSGMQGRIFDAEVTATEKGEETDALRSQLSTALAARETAEHQLAALTAGAKATGGALSPEGAQRLNLMSSALRDMAAERDQLKSDLAEAQSQIADLGLDRRLDQERDDRIFSKLEDAVSTSMAPMDKLFDKLGFDSKTLLDAMQSREDGKGGPLTPIALSTRGRADPEELRANGILGHLQTLKLYGMAVEALPLALPLETSYRITSPFGYRTDPIRGGRRSHEGVDLAAAYGSPVVAPADGTVIFAGWSTGYGRLIKIQHPFGVETRYGHLSKINVKVGQNVSRGDRIGAMGSSGRSTGSHLHYEVRIGDRPTDPMTFMTAARDVF